MLTCVDLASCWLIWKKKSLFTQDSNSFRLWNRENLLARHKFSSQGDGAHLMVMYYIVWYQITLDTCILNLKQTDFVFPPTGDNNRFTPEEQQHLIN